MISVAAGDADQYRLAVRGDQLTLQVRVYLFTVGDDGVVVLFGADPSVLRRSRDPTWTRSSRASASASDPPDAGTALPRCPGRSHVRGHARLCRPALRPSHLRLLGERRTRLDTVAPRLAAGGPTRGVRVARGPRSRPTRSRPQPMAPSTLPSNLPAPSATTRPPVDAGVRDRCAGGRRPVRHARLEPVRARTGPDRPRRRSAAQVRAARSRPRHLRFVCARRLSRPTTPVAYAQFGPLSAYPRAQRIRELYPQLPSAPPPGVITCIATVAAARGLGYARALVLDVCEELARRGFAAVEAYPDMTRPIDETSAATPELWLGCGFDVAVRRRPLSGDASRRSTSRARRSPASAVHAWRSRDRELAAGGGPNG